MKSLCFVLLALFITAPSAQASQCKAKKKVADLSGLAPSAVLPFATINAETLKNPGDLMCCLAEQDPNLKIVVMNNSVAAQGGAPAHPRVLLVRTNPKTNKLDSVYSLNSGAGHLGGDNSVEVLSYANTPKGQLFDIEMPAKQKSAKPNPAKCMSCHGGDENGRANAAGIKPIFERDPWLRMNDPLFTDLAQVRACPNLAKHIPTMRNDAEEALKTKEPYRCLKNLKRMSGTEFDGLISDRNNDRVAFQASNTKDFKKFQWAAVGASMCDLFTPEKYFPPHQISQMNNVDAIQDKRIRESHTLEDTNAATKHPNPIVEDLKKADSAFIYNKEKQLNLPIDLVSCQLPDKVFRSKTSNNVYMKYRIDSDRLHADPKLGILRYIFESRGIDIKDWNTSHLGSYGRAPDFAKALANAPWADKTLQDIIKRKDCGELQKRSLAAFGPPPVYSPEELNDESGGKKIE